MWVFKTLCSTAQKELPDRSVHNAEMHNKTMNLKRDALVYTETHSVGGMLVAMVVEFAQLERVQFDWDKGEIRSVLRGFNSWDGLANWSCSQGGLFSPI